MLPPLDHALTGFAAGVTRLNAAGRRLASTGAGDDTPRDVAALLHARHQVRANLAVIRTADEMVGTLLDVFA